MEKWINVTGFERYQVSDFGNVRGSRGLMKPRINGRGYVMVGLRRNGEPQKIFNIHRLVAGHFIPNPNGYKYVNHIDGDKTNNDCNNLEWCTQSQNQLHAYEKGLQVLTDEQVSRLNYYAKEKRRPIRVVNKKLGIDKAFESIKEAGDSLDCNEKTLRNVLMGRNVSRLGYEVYYLDE